MTLVRCLEELGFDNFLNLKRNCKVSMQVGVGKGLVHIVLSFLIPLFVSITPNQGKSQGWDAGYLDFRTHSLSVGS